MSPNPASILPALKGARATVLLALLMSPASMGPKQLSTLTNYDRQTVSHALDGLSALGLAQQHARYSGWTTTQLSRQMILGELPPPSEREILPLPSGGCSFTQDKSDDPLIITTTTTTAREGENSPLPPEYRKAKRLLIDACATNPNAAHRTIRQLLEDNADPLWIQIDILTWLDYCTSPAGKGIDYPGAFIPTRLLQRIACPPSHELSYTTTNAVRTLNLKIDRRDRKENET